MFATYSNRVVRAGGLGTAQSAKLINNALMTAITGLVYDAFALGDEFEVPLEALGEVLGNGSAANPSVDVFLALGGAREFSIKAWPTLHKDIALIEQVTSQAAATAATRTLLACASTTIREMERLRA
jgi:3-hydroxyisobutyrate dehydrogenase-like beta-hydroxyacid dehydrogenase